jgi:hypothetical protein
VTYEEAVAQRKADALDIKIEEALEILLSQADTVGPDARHHLKGILGYYAKKAHPFRACFTADTPVDMPRDLERFPEGVPISALRPGDLVWAFDQERRMFALRPVVSSERTRQDAELLAVQIDSGKTIRCTPDHEFLLRDGRWRQARELRSGDSLMPLHRDFEPRVRLRPDAIGYTSEHAVVAEAIHGALDGLHVHHEDYRHANVHPTNLLALTGSEHAQIHHDGFAEAAALRDESWQCRRCQEMFTPTMRNQRICSPCATSGPYSKKLVGKMSKCEWEGCGVEYEVASPNHRYCSPACRIGARLKRRRLGESALSDRGRAPETWNHKVIAVRPLQEREDVWDIEVEDLHTFVVHGVVVHNCVRDNMKRFGPGRTEAVCATLKDILRGTTKWRGHPELDHGSPGLATALSDDAPVISDELAEFLMQVPDERIFLVEMKLFGGS